MPTLEEMFSMRDHHPVEPMTREGAIGSLQEAYRRWHDPASVRAGDLVRYAPGTMSQASVAQRNPTAVFIVIEVLENVPVNEAGGRSDLRLAYYDTDNDLAFANGDARLFEPIPENES